MPGTGPDARLRAVLGDDAGDDASQAEQRAVADWAQGYGVVSPDVARYVDVLRAPPDAVLLAMRNLAGSEGVELVDPDTATLVALLARSMRPERVLEVGTGIGYLTLQLARAVPADCTVTSIERDPLRQGQAHAFLERDDHEGVTELRLGDALELLRERTDPMTWDLVVLTDPAAQRLEVIDVVADTIGRDGLLLVPRALMGGRVADHHRTWERQTGVEEQRALNRSVAMDPRFGDVTLLPVGDGLLLARRCR